MRKGCGDRTDGGGDEKGGREGYGEEIGRGDRVWGLRVGIESGE